MVRASVGILVMGLWGLWGCGPDAGGPAGPMGTMPGPGKVPPQTGPAPSAYPGSGFIVHEWGTNTLVVGSDGSLQRGLHHEEEDLPAFVYDRIHGGQLAGPPSVELKMETPVTYFYSDQPLSAKVSVSFPQGIFSQFYPAVRSFEPHIAVPPSSQDFTPGDPVLDVHFPFLSQHCIDKYSPVKGGLLDWGDVQVLGRDASVDGELPAAPLDRYTWSHARAVAANAVRLSGAPLLTPQTERFLFYRGLGNTPIPVRVTAGPGGALSITDTDPGQAVGAAFVLNVGPQGGAFKSHPEGIAAGATLNDTTPGLAGAAALPDYAAALADAVVSALDRTGLYHDEALAMVNTWRRQWFTTPGIRVLYLAPQAWTDAQIPLSIVPGPQAMVRVMVIRTEVITPELEAGDTAQALALGPPGTHDSAVAYFQALGRFAEPRLRRALSLLGTPPMAATQYLAQIATADISTAAGE